MQEALIQWWFYALHLGNSFVTGEVKTGSKRFCTGSVEQLLAPVRGLLSEV